MALFDEICFPCPPGGRVNFTGEGTNAVVKAAYSPDVYARLQEVNDRYDPSNLFRHNQNVEPSGRPAYGRQRPSSPSVRRR